MKPVKPRRKPRKLRSREKNKLLGDALRHLDYMNSPQGRADQMLASLAFAFVGAAAGAFVGARSAAFDGAQCVRCKHTRGEHSSRLCLAADCTCAGFLGASS